MEQVRRHLPEGGARVGPSWEPGLVAPEPEVYRKGRQDTAHGPWRVQEGLC